ncbi:hypothetical protein NUU61_008147 [Penicillium alfredii]|uniref:Uncharacterized protein n=1 Tax=Penicillium alfredii TaxID=1506179 RepID=A0A9W9ES40_9EURO|nr:uncharacterized protein NUU61_008147 [Penicillium alfredii]KAJ5086840.1 hypothetical protein NUU61_008147 [Penicillium alfredii]
MSTAAPQGPIEARSLSSITAIASNPPAYPRNPTHEKLDSLALYIVRVPGSKAVTDCAWFAPVSRHLSLPPLKPPTKASVSAEAINASLYYLHVATPDDNALLQEVELEREDSAHVRKEAQDAAGPEDPAQHDFARLNYVRRKPVGATGDSGPGPEPEPDPAPAVVQPENVAPPAVSRRPVPMPEVSAENVSFAGTPVASVPPPRDSELPGAPPVEPVVTKTAIPRRPLPPLPPNEVSWSNSPTGNDEPGASNQWSAFTGNLQNRGLEAWKEKSRELSSGRHSLDFNRPQLRPISTNDRPQSPTRSPGQSPTRPRRAYPGAHENKGFHLTLIRRDPTSGTQWNVATISTPRMDCNAIDIEISTPGYNRFTGTNEPLSLASLAANLPPGIKIPAMSAVPTSLEAEPPRAPAAGPRKFHRQVCVSRPFDDFVSPGDRTSNDYGNGHGPEGASSKLKSGYYMFKSPWNGTCTFSSSVNGRSLKCKHMIPGPGGHVPATSESDASPAVTVAEIRFNTPFQAANLHSHAHHAAHRPHPHHMSPFHLSQNPAAARDPTSSEIPNSYPDPAPLDGGVPSTASKRNSLSQLLNPNTYSRPRARSGDSAALPPPPSDPRSNLHPAAILRRSSLRAQRFARQNQFPPHHHHRSTSTSSGGPDSDEDRLDLSLAREPAGGGMRGKSAKLGKLIIEDEGIKMLDLVVASCMTVWWRGYYY